MNPFLEKNSYLLGLCACLAFLPNDLNASPSLAQDIPGDEIHLQSWPQGGRSNLELRLLKDLEPQVQQKGGESFQEVLGLKLAHSPALLMSVPAARWAFPGWWRSLGKVVSRRVWLSLLAGGGLASWWYGKLQRGHSDGVWMSSLEESAYKPNSRPKVSEEESLKTSDSPAKGVKQPLVLDDDEEDEEGYYDDLAKELDQMDDEDNLKDEFNETLVLARKKLQDDVAELMVAYEDMNYKDWARHLTPYLQDGAITEIDPLDLLKDLDDFIQKPSGGISVNEPVSEFRGVMVQYVFLIWVMKLKPMTLGQIGMSLKSRSAHDDSSIHGILDEIKSFLNNYPDHTTQMQQASFDHSKFIKKSIDKFKKKYFALDVTELQKRLHFLVPESVLPYINYKNLIGFFERKATQGALYSLLGYYLKLDTGSEGESYDQEQFWQDRKLAREILSSLSLEDLGTAVANDEKNHYDSHQIEVVVEKEVQDKNDVYIISLDILKDLFFDLELETLKERLSFLIPEETLSHITHKAFMAYLEANFKQETQHIFLGSFLNLGTISEGSFFSLYNQKASDHRRILKMNLQSLDPRSLRSTKNHDGHRDPLPLFPSLERLDILKKEYFQLSVIDLRRRLEPFISKDMIQFIDHESFLKYLEVNFTDEILVFFMTSRLGLSSLENTENLLDEEKEKNISDYINMELRLLTLEKILDSYNKLNNSKSKALITRDSSFYKEGTSSQEVERLKAEFYKLPLKEIKLLLQPYVTEKTLEVLDHDSLMSYMERTMKIERMHIFLYDFLKLSSLDRDDFLKYHKDLPVNSFYYHKRVLTKILSRLSAKDLFKDKESIVGREMLADVTKKYYELGVSNLKMKLSSLVPKNVLDHVDHQSFMNYLQRKFTSEKIHVFLASILKLKKLTYEEFRKLYNKNTAKYYKAHIKQVLSNLTLDEFLQDNPKSMPAEKRWLHLKKEYFEIDISKLKDRLKPWVSTETLEAINHENLMNYLLGRHFSEERMHVFLGNYLNLDPLSRKSFYAFYKQDGFGNHNFRLRKILKNITAYDLTQDLLAPKSLEEVDTLNQKLWHQIEGSGGEILWQGLNIDEKSGDEFLDLLTSLRARYQAHTRSNKELFLLYHLLSNNKIFLSDYTSMYGLSLNRLVVEHGEVLEDLGDMVQLVFRSFGSSEDLYLHQKETLDKLVRDEISFIPTEYRLKIVDREDLGKSLDHFLRSHKLHKDVVSTSLLYAALGIPLISVRSLSSLWNLSESKMVGRMNSLKEMWRQDHIIETVVPLSEAELLQRFQNLSSSQWQMLASKWLAEEGLTPEGFADLVVEFLESYSSTEEHHFKRHIFLSLVLKLEQPTRHLLAHIMKTHGLKNSLGPFLQGSELSKINQNRRRIHLEFQAKIMGKKHKKNRNFSIKTQEDLRDITRKNYEGISDKKIKYLARSWGFTRGADLLYFEYKLRSFVGYLLRYEGDNFDVFISFNLDLMSMDSYKFSDVKGWQATTVSSRKKALDSRFRGYIQGVVKKEGRGVRKEDRKLERYLDYDLEYVWSTGFESWSQSLDLHASSPQMLRREVVRCGAKVLKSFEDLVIFSSYTLKIHPMDLGEVSEYLGEDSSYVLERSEVMEKAFRDCFGAE